MTAIAGFVASDGKVWIGGDSAGIGGWDLVVREDAKVFRNGEFLFGFTSSFRMGQLLRYSLCPPIPTEGQDLYSFMVTTFVDAVRSCLKSGGYAEREKEAEKAGTFLVGFRGRLFSVEQDYQVAEAKCKYAACGCGAQIVNGALFAIHEDDTTPEAKIKTALEAAEYHCAGVRAPFILEYL